MEECWSFKWDWVRWRAGDAVAEDPADDELEQWIGRLAWSESVFTESTRLITGKSFEKRARLFIVHGWVHFFSQSLWHRNLFKFFWLVIYLFF